MKTRISMVMALLLALMVGWGLGNADRQQATGNADERQKTDQVVPASQAVAVAKRRAATRQQPVEDDGKLRIICFGAHPDDAEYKSGGTAAKWVRAGHHVKLVSVTNGDIGHWQITPLLPQICPTMDSTEAL